MSISWVTRCPFCQTAFHVNRVQIEAAKGLVRCGSCNAIFRAGPTKKVPLSFQPSTVQTVSFGDESIHKGLDLAKKSERFLGLRRSGSTLCWSLVFVVVLACVFFYTAYFWPRLSQNRKFRALVEKGCVLLQCHLPARVALDKIRSTKILLAPVAGKSRQMLVTVFLYNTANFAQPYPDLELIFSDQHGNQMATRFIEPATYLRADLDKNSMMPSQVLVQVSFEITAPTTSAVGYELRFRKHLVKL